MFPALEKNLSLGTLVAGIIRYLMATGTKYGYEPILSLHQSNGSSATGQRGSP